VSIRMNIRRCYGQVKRAYRALRSRLRRTRVAVGMLVVLLLALGEPLLCIIHCQIWMPYAHHSYSAAQHAHMHHTSSHAMMSAEPATTGSTGLVASRLPSGDANCFMLRPVGSHDGAPLHEPPSPVHDLLPTLVALIALVLLTSIHLAAPPGAPPKVPPPLLLRPPIPFAV
jgi:hypothetical protein